MILNEMNKYAPSQFGKINSFLKSNYGFSLKESASDDQLRKTKQLISEKMNAVEHSVSSPEYAMCIMIIEGIDDLIDRRDQERTHNTYQRVLDGLEAYVLQCVNIGDEEDDAIKNAMKEYNSSIYRFPSHEVEYNLRKRIETNRDIFEPSEITAETITLEDNNDMQAITDANIINHGTEHSDYFQGCGSGNYEHVVTGAGSSEREAYIDALEQMASSGVDVSSLEADIEKASSDMIAIDDDQYVYISIQYNVGDEVDEGIASDDRRGDIGLHKEIKDQGAKLHAHLDKLRKSKGLQSLELEPIDKSSTDDSGKFWPSRRRVGESVKEDFVKELRMILESDVQQAEVLIAAKGFGQEIQVMIEKTGRLMNEDLNPVVDQMRLAFGMEHAESFQESMLTDLQSILDTLKNVKENIDVSVIDLSQGKLPNSDTDMEGGMDEFGLDGDAVAMPNEFEDEFGGADATSGPEEEPLGRPQKESIQFLKQQLEEMRKQLSENAYDVYLNGKKIDTVHFKNMSAEEVKKSLIDHDGYESNIVVKKVK